MQENRRVVHQTRRVELRVPDFSPFESLGVESVSGKWTWNRLDELFIQLGDSWTRHPGSYRISNRQFPSSISSANLRLRSRLRFDAEGKALVSSGLRSDAVSGLGPMQRARPWYKQVGFYYEELILSLPIIRRHHLAYTDVEKTSEHFLVFTW
uniref:Uncharacterized protein n=1 Tax=Lactuca sativa TaxID=4236 RepID=A0A9R1XBD3_LACSA|nr:hypothetical protein LSAT_V11C500248720 [Lactuca sativa]